MGKDLIAGGRNVHHKRRTAPKSDNAYLALLVKLYRFLSRRTDSKFNEIVLRRLFHSRTNRPSMGVARVARYLGKSAAPADAIAVLVGKVTDDSRVVGKFPKIRIAALGFTEGAKARIEAAGGECMTLDQLALAAPTGHNTVLLRGRRTAREANRYFGVPGTPGTHVKPKVRAKGRKFERARGRRRSRGFKV